MTRKTVIVAAVLIVSPILASATIINIPADYPTIQEGINASVDGDTVLVQPGMYYENINFNGHNIVLGSLFLTTGDTSYIGQTVIDGDSAGTVVTFENGENGTTIIGGFTIQNGFSITGAGVFCFHTNPVISNNIIRDNIAITKGGGIRIDQSEPLIYNNTIINNTAIYNGKGGGIYSIWSNTIIRKNRIAENNVFLSGGGIFSASNVYVLIDSNIIENNHADLGGGLDSYHTNVDIFDNVFRHNTGDSRGGAIKCSDSTAVIRNNNIFDNNGGNGAGIYCDSVNAQIIENTISGNNSVAGGGGGIYASNGNVLIKSNTISDNSSFWGGSGIRSNFCMITIINNIVDYNIAELSGGGIFTFFGGNYICGNIISHNSAGESGGGIYSYRNEYLQIDIIFNNVLFGNTAESGGGISCFRSVCQIGNNVLYGNIALTQGGGLAGGRSIISIINSIIWGNSSPIDPEIAILGDTNISVNYCDIAGGWPGIGNVVIDPLFRDPASGDFHLMSTACGDPYDSPCIDAGDPNILDSLLDCSSGLGGPRSDMGAYGGGDSLITAIFDDLPSTPVNFMLLQNYPNPFNAVTTIKFASPKAQNVKLIVYDLLGRQVEILIDEYKDAGVHNIIFDASALSSGVYFYRLRAGDAVETKRMVLLK